MVNEMKITSIEKSFNRDDLLEGLKIRKGKKVYHKARLMESSNIENEGSKIEVTIDELSEIIGLN